MKAKLESMIKRRRGGRKEGSRRNESEWETEPSCGIEGNDRVVAPSPPQPALLGVWATVCHYPDGRRNITHSRSGVLRAEMSEQEGG